MTNLLKLSFVFCALVFASCGDDSKQYDKEIGYDQAMQNYMNAQGWTGIGLPSGMYYVVENEGGSEKPDLEVLSKIAYKGYYTDDQVFDSSPSLTIRLKGTIEGWQIGVPKFGRGGKGHLLIPPNLAYGENPNNGIRPRSILIFDVKVLDF